LKHGRFLIVALPVVLAAFMASYLSLEAANQSAIAAAPNTISAEPLWDSSEPLATVREVREQAAFSTVRDVDIEVEQDEDAISVAATNRADKTLTLEIDRWVTQISGVTFDLTLPSEREMVDGASFEIPAGGSSLVKKFDLSDYSETFDTFPGIYKFKVNGLYWNETLGRNDIAVSLIANVTIGYDFDRIAAASDRILKSNNVVISVDGEEPTFAVEDNATKRVNFFLKNQGREPISQIVSGYSILVWNAEDRTKADGMKVNVDWAAGPCEPLKEGDAVPITTIDLARDVWPLGGKGISEEYGRETAVPGLYVVDILVYTASCTTEDKDLIEGGTYSLIAAFELEGEQ
jgi:hypothetical protein